MAVKKVKREQGKILLAVCFLGTDYKDCADKFKEYRGIRAIRV